MIHVAMFPHLAMGHLIAYLHLSNRLAERGHKVSFFVPTKPQPDLNPFNHHPHLISFISLTVPHVQGLPLGAQTMADVPLTLVHFFWIAIDNMQNQIKLLLQELKPDLILYDITHRLSSIARDLGIKTVHHCTTSASNNAYFLVPSRNLPLGIEEKLPETNYMVPPLDFPRSSLKLHLFEVLTVFPSSNKFGDDISFHQRLLTALNNCDAISFRTCREMEGKYCDYLNQQFKKPILLTGPALPETPNTPLEKQWDDWLSRFDPGSVIYCSFGSECILQTEQFQELVLGLELTGLPFLVALKPPFGFTTVEESLPSGFKERIGDRGVVYGGWVQQTLILAHPSVGCFVTHCGFGSMWESLASDCQIVGIPQGGDQFLNARVLSGELKVALEVERREEDGWFSKESIHKAVKEVMDGENQVGNELKENHAKWKQVLLSEGLEDAYIDSFIEKLQDLLEN
ncbi:hypothetical protein GIB67_039258 [Kingdonia uniflora]|uniref:Glycosyltransferase n=1 Tax=Kingdonia uniflora TaxID=39325 RepID=A0A7J7MM78_9MAGN|nr:hypothetical protein GIB67_039258 [Kingdonia uniflora]